LAQNSGHFVQSETPLGLQASYIMLTEAISPVLHRACSAQFVRVWMAAPRAAGSPGSFHRRIKCHRLMVDAMAVLNG
jgi:hypothetical protein